MNTQEFWRREAAQVRDASGVLGRAEVLDTSHLSPGGEVSKKCKPHEMDFDMPPSGIAPGRLCPIGSLDGQVLSGNIFFEIDRMDTPTRIDEPSLKAYVERFRSNVRSVFPQAEGVNFIPVLQGDFEEGVPVPSAENNVHLLVGYGAGNPSRPISHVRFEGDKNLGYMIYTPDPGYAAHEFAHLCGLADRYAEGILIKDGNGSERNPPSLLSRATLPLILEHDHHYDPMTNLMSREGVFEPSITPQQMAIVMDSRAWEPNFYTATFFLKAVDNDTVETASRFRKNAVRMAKGEYMQYYELDGGRLVAVELTENLRHNIAYWCKFAMLGKENHQFESGGGTGYTKGEKKRVNDLIAAMPDPYTVLVNVLNEKLPKIKGVGFDKLLIYRALCFLGRTGFLGMLLFLLCCPAAVFGQPEPASVPPRWIYAGIELGDNIHHEELFVLIDLKDLDTGQPLFLSPWSVYVTQGLRLEGPLWGVRTLRWVSESPYYERPADVPSNFMFPSLEHFSSLEWGTVVSSALLGDVLASKYVEFIGIDSVAPFEGNLLPAHIRAPLVGFEVRRNTPIFGDTVPDALKGCPLKSLELPCGYLGDPGTLWPQSLEDLSLSRASLLDVAPYLPKLKVLEYLSIHDLGSDSLAPRMLLDMMRACPSLESVDVRAVPCPYDGPSCWYVDSLYALLRLPEFEGVKVSISPAYWDYEDEDDDDDDYRDDAILWSLSWWKNRED